MITTKVSAADIEAILGVKISATTQVDLKIEIRGSNLYMITVDYSCNDDSVHNETSYTYKTDIQ